MRHAGFVECRPRVRCAGPGRLRADCSGGTGGLFGRLLVLEQSVSGALHHVSPVTSSQRECISISSLSAASPSSPLKVEPKQARTQRDGERSLQIRSEFVIIEAVRLSGQWRSCTCAFSGQLKDVHV